MDSIVMDDAGTSCYLSVTNLNTEGNAWFCADRDIILRDPVSNKKYQMIRSESIPVCPDAYYFSHAGEVLSFSLYFPPLGDRTGEIDLIENCADNCFTLQGIVLDPQLNEEIRQFEKAVEAYNEDNLSLALSLFMELQGSGYTKENHYAYTLYIIPLIHERLGNKSEATEAYFSLKESSIRQRDYFLKKLREIPYFLQLD